MQTESLKKSAALFAMNYVKKNFIVGIGTGSTVFHFIKFLKEIKSSIKGVVSSSKQSTMLLERYGFSILSPNNVQEIDVYIDGADEVNKELILIKGGGGALTGEKILANMSKKFICIVDETKKVKSLGKFPLPVEVLQIAISSVKRKLEKLGGISKERKNFFTDYGNKIIDVFQLNMKNAIQLEETINNIPGVVTVGIFGNRKPDIVILSKKTGIQILKNY